MGPTYQVALGSTSKFVGLAYRLAPNVRAGGPPAQGRGATVLSLRLTLKAGRRMFAMRYGNGTETVLSSSPFASDTSATARPSFNDGVTLTARKPALSRRACSTAARRDPLAFAIAAVWLCAAV